MATIIMVILYAIGLTCIYGMIEFESDRDKYNGKNEEKEEK